MTQKKQVLCGLRVLFLIFNCQTPELKDGQKEFYDDGITKLKDMVDKDLQDILDRLEAIQSDEVSYDSYSGKDSSMSGNVKFIIETASIDAPDAE